MRPSENASCPNFAQTPYSPPISPYSIHNMNLERINIMYHLNEKFNSDTTYYVPVLLLTTVNCCFLYNFLKMGHNFPYFLSIIWPYSTVLLLF